MSMITISLCLSKIPKEKIKKGKDGLMYVNLILSERKEKGKYDETHTLAVSKTKEERALQEKPIYVGSGKLYETKPVEVVTSETIDSLPAVDENDDLPF